MMAELFALFTQARDAGFEFGSMMTLVGIYWRLESAAKKRDKAMTEKNDARWGQLISTLDSHSKTNEERFTKIETHIGLKK